jgi:hypothetical protein
MELRTQKARVFAEIPSETERVGKAVLDAAYRVHTALGPGLLESVYEACHAAQLLTYLRLTGVRLGFLINFTVPHLKDGIKRLVV